MIKIIRIPKDIKQKYGLTSPGPRAGLCKLQALRLLRREAWFRGDPWIMAEYRFLEAWKERRFYPKGLLSVRKATEFEDYFRKTDAVMNISSGIEIRIQIKCVNKVRYREFEDLVREGIVLVNIKPSDSLEAIRQITIDSILLCNDLRIRIAQDNLRNRFLELTLSPSREMTKVNIVLDTRNAAHETVTAETLGEIC